MLEDIIHGAVVELGRSFVIVGGKKEYEKKGEVAILEFDPEEEVWVTRNSFCTDPCSQVHWRQEERWEKDGEHHNGGKKEKSRKWRMGIRVTVDHSAIGGTVVSD